MNKNLFQLIKHIAITFDLGSDYKIVNDLKRIVVNTSAQNNITIYSKYDSEYAFIFNDIYTMVEYDNIFNLSSIELNNLKYLMRHTHRVFNLSPDDTIVFTIGSDRLNSIVSLSLLSYNLLYKKIENSLLSITCYNKPPLMNTLVSNKHSSNNYVYAIQ